MIFRHQTDLQMKKLLIMAALLALAWNVSCSGDSEEDLFGAPDCSIPVSPSADILPLLQNNCALSGCHTGGTGLPNFAEKQTVLTYADEIRRRTREGSMPPPNSGVSLTREEINLITCWVDQGKKDN